MTDDTMNFENENTEGNVEQASLETTDENTSSAEGVAENADNTSFILKDSPQITSDTEEASPDAEDKQENNQAYPYNDSASEYEYVKPKKKSGKGKTVAFVTACAVLFGVVAGAMAGLSSIVIRKYANSKISIQTTQNALTKEKGASQINSEIADIAEECMPSIVSISNKSVRDVMTFFGTYQQESISSGSGIIIGKNDTELLVVTNYHVIAESQELSVIFTDSDDPVLNGDNSQQDLQNGIADNKNVIAAKVKGYDSDKDLAVISVKLDDISADVLSNIKVATIGDSSALRPGEQVIAIGNALGYGQSVTTGIVSATNRAVTLESQTSNGTVTNKFIQTDAAINPGNSGGALLNMNGELVGINSVKIAANGVEGMGYAIPISDVESIIGELMVRETRDVVDEDKQGFLGITFEDVSAEISEAYGLPQGVFVKTVSAGSAAEKAGLKRGYIITKFDGYTVKTGAELQNRLTYYKAGETKNITVQIQNGDTYEEKDISITLDSKKERSKIMDDEMKKQNGQNQAPDQNNGNNIPNNGQNNGGFFW